MKRVQNLSSTQESLGWLPTVLSKAIPPPGPTWTRKQKIMKKSAMPLQKTVHNTVRCTTRYNAVWNSTVRCDMVRCGVMWYGTVWYGTVRCGAVWCGTVRCGVMWYGTVWCGTVPHFKKDTTLPSAMTERDECSFDGGTPKWDGGEIWWSFMYKMSAHCIGEVIEKDF